MDVRVFLKQYFCPFPFVFLSSSGTVSYTHLPGFKSIRIAPSLGDLKEVSGTMPHPVGSVTASYKLDKKGKLTARLILPTGTDGVFVWKGKEYQLKSGEQVLTVE